MERRFYAGYRSAVCRSNAGVASPRREGNRYKETYSVNFTVPIVLMILCIAIAGLIFWGGFSEERRARR
jgi:hypothetical protein